MYSLGVYLPIRNKKQKLDEDPDTGPYNRSAKNDTSKKGGIVNNFYITIKMDSLQKARNKANGGDDGLAGDGQDGSSASGKHRRGGDGTDADASTDADGGSDKPFKLEDARVDTVNGRPVYRFFVYFEFNQYTLNSKGFSTVDRAIGQLRSDPGTTIMINGYTDDIGTIPQNNFISRKRAQMVFDYMNSRGIGSERMVPKFFGKSNPVASNEDPNTAWLNRRVEIIVQDKDKEVGLSH
jgi:outer membrane protein OmpA-like peptidoglycan-associated protein